MVLHLCVVAGFACSVKFRASDAPVGSKVYKNTTIYQTHSTNNTFSGFEEVVGCWICNSIAAIHL
jgi:hypothetical protein